MTTPDKTTEATGQDIAVTSTNSTEARGCYACARYRSPTGVHNHRVFLIRLHQMTVTLCPNCARDLVALLQKHDPGRKGRL